MLAQLREIVGHHNVTTEASDLEHFGQDWTRFFKPAPMAIIFPKNTEQVVQIVKLANQQKLALVPSGGRTGLSGGAVAERGELVVSFDKMNQVLSFDETDRTVTVQAGVITANLQTLAMSKGLYYPVDFASSGSSQIGGNIATNAGGIKVLRYGLSRDWVAGLTVVTGAGEHLQLNQGLVKNATGYDLRHLFIGSEGTLGLITEATIRLTRSPPTLKVVLLAVPAMTDTISILRTFDDRVDLSAFEFFSDQALDHVIRHNSIPLPFAVRASYYVLLEYEVKATPDDVAALDAFESCVTAGWVVDGIVGESEQQNRSLWKYRESISESITRHMPYKNDVAVRVSQVPGFLAQVQEKVESAYPEFEIIWFGHIGDGNLHLNILKPESWSAVAFKKECELVSEQIMSIVAAYQGSVSAEHGVGLLKKEQLHFSRSPEEIEIMVRLKDVFDPNGIMNPGKLLPGIS